MVGGNVPYKNRTKNAQEIGVVFGQRSQLWRALPFIESFKLLKDIYQIADRDYEDMLEMYRSLADIEPLLSWLSPLFGCVFFWLSCKLRMFGAMKYS